MVQMYAAEPRVFSPVGILDALRFLERPLTDVGSFVAARAISKPASIAITAN